MTEAVNGPSDGGKYIDQIDPEDPEYVRQMQRPAEVKEDMRQMEDRSRVTRIMQTKAFREELEVMIDSQLRSGPHPASLLALQQISELILPQAKAGSSGGFIGGVSGNVIPIADIRGVDSLNYSKGEKLMRNKTATLYRLVDMHGGSNGFNGIISTRLSQDYEHFLVIPYGMLYREVTASNLLKVDMRGEVLDPGSTTLGLNRAAFSLNAAVHAARPDLKTLIHIRTNNAVSVSVQNCGLLPLCPEAMSLGELSYYTYSGVLVDQEEKDKLTRALGPNNKVIFLRSYGVLVGGKSIDEAFLMAQNVLTAVDTQLSAIQVGLDNIAMPSDEVCKRAQDLANQGPGEGDGKKKWRRGEMEFEAYNRQLDNAGYRTGHQYREPISRRQDKRERANSEVEIPPAATSGSAMYEDEFRSPLKHHLDKQKKTYRTEWLNSPNAYKREEIDEIGTPNPKKITKWVMDAEDGVTSPSVKVEQPNQFAPQGDNPKELKQKYKEIRKEYYEDKIDAGPQSRILDGITYDEAKLIQDGHVSGTSDTMIVVGAASKGIIQRDHQHNAVVYKTYYAPNPFDNMSEDEIAKYKAEVEQRGGAGDAVTSGDEVEVTPGPDGHLISTQERMHQIREGPEGSTTVTTTVVTTKQVQDSTINGEQAVLGSPTKSTSSAVDTQDEVERSSREGSPSKEATSASESPEKRSAGDKKKKKFRMPSFSSKKKEKK